MSQKGDERLRFQLDQLEAKGRRTLGVAARREAFRAALNWAAPASLIGSSLSLAWVLSSRHAPGGGALTAVAAFTALATAVSVYAWRAPRHAVDRREALALFDHRFGLKDRIVSADQFVVDTGRGAFEEAALDEARPWIDRALGLSVDTSGQLGFRRSRLWFYPLGAAAVLGLALAIPHADRLIAAARGEHRPPVRSTVSTARLAPVAGAPPTLPLAASEGHGTNVAPKDKARRDGGPIRSALSTLANRALAALGLKAGDGSGEAEPSSPRGGAGRSAADAGPARKAAGHGAQGETQEQAASAGSQDGVAVTDTAPASEGRTASEERAVSADAAKAPPQGGSARQDAPSQRPTPPRQDNSQQGQSGEGQQQQPSRSRKGDQKSNGREQGGGEGENGRRSGDDAGAKKGRGVASLLLATPMQDRLTGMAGEGRIATTTREGRPQTFPSQGAQAQDRNAATGAIGAVPHRADAAHDQRLLRDVFSRRDPKDEN